MFPSGAWALLPCSLEPPKGQGKERVVAKTDPRKDKAINKMQQKKDLVVPKLTNSGTGLSLDCSLSEVISSSLLQLLFIESFAVFDQ